MQRKWSTEADLAALIMVRAEADKIVTLTPETAQFVALKLITASKKPTSAEVAMMICDSKCASPCYPCQGKANIITRAYGNRATAMRSPPHE